MVLPLRLLASVLPILFMTSLTVSTATGKPVVLPDKAPIPHLQQPPNPEARKPAETERSETKKLAPPEEQEQETPGTIPVPEAKPTAPPEPEQPADEKKQPEKKPVLADPRSAEIALAQMPADERTCRERLKTLGVEFEERKAEHDPEIGCSVPYPLSAKTLGADIDIAPEAILNCAMTEAAARFATEIIVPAAKAEFGAGLKSISQASTYVCRPRHGGGKMSEHAFGNALDIASFTLTNGAIVEIGPVPPDKDKKFLDTLRKAACGPFKTVLGPGSDADHAQHFHLDLEPRRNGGTFCQ